MRACTGYEGGHECVCSDACGGCGWAGLFMRVGVLVPAYVRVWAGG